MTWNAGQDVAERAGVEPFYLVQLVDLGILAPEQSDQFSPGDVRRVLMARSLEKAGIPLDEVVAAIQHGALSLDFVDAAGFDRFAALATETFRQVSNRTGIPLELLAVIREAIGMAPPSPDDRLREDELTIVPYIELQLSEGFRPGAIERLLRVQGRQHPSDGRTGGRLVELRGDRAGQNSGQGFGGCRERRPHRSDRPAHRSSDPGYVPRPSGA